MLTSVVLLKVTTLAGNCLPSCYAVHPRLTPDGTDRKAYRRCGLHIEVQVHAKYAPSHGHKGNCCCHNAQDLQCTRTQKWTLCSHLQWRPQHRCPSLAHSSSLVLLGMQ